MGAYAITLGIDPYKVITQGHEDYLISIALMKKAMKLSNEQKVADNKLNNEQKVADNKLRNEQILP